MINELINGYLQLGSPLGINGWQVIIGGLVLCVLGYCALKTYSASL
jgi:hypothetical protein